GDGEDGAHEHEGAEPGAQERCHEHEALGALAVHVEPERLSPAEGEHDEAADRPGEEDRRVEKAVPGVSGMPEAVAPGSSLDAHSNGLRSVGIGMPAVLSAARAGPKPSPSQVTVGSRSTSAWPCSGRH